MSPSSPDTIVDPQAAERGLVSHYFRRPLNWHCSRCGWFCDHGGSDSYLCVECGQLRPLWAMSATMSVCTRCEHWSLGMAEYCEWCGAAKLAEGHGGTGRSPSQPRR